jgi:aspartyl-tRNA(Asn)/glutamyl-tRNA(Gln) amidotransferase subunit B
MTMVDLNRTGIPLLEIVTEPDMRSVDEAKAYMETLLGILQYLGVSDCKMQEGSVRFEPSISLRPFGQEALGSRVEIKNVNSISTVVKILEYEERRQSAALDHGEPIARTTSLWDERLGRTVPMRSKEMAQDYRYFPEPDLVPIEIDDGWLERVRAALPELPLARRRRFIADLGLPPYDAGVLVDDKALADYFEACLALGAEPKSVSNWLMVTVLRELNARQVGIDELGVPAERLCELIALVDDGTIAQNTGKKVFAAMAETGRSAAEIVEEQGLRQVSDAGELEEIVLGVLRDNPQAVEDLRAGKKKAQGFLMGQIMRATKGKANPQVVSQLIARKLPEA